MRLNLHNHLTILQEKYDKDKYVKIWNNTIEEVNKDDNTCHYLKTLTQSINQYKRTIYPSTYKERFGNLVLSLPVGVEFNCFIRIRCYVGSLCVKSFNERDDFQKEIDKKENNRVFKVQNAPNIFSYHASNCFHVVLCGYQNCNIYLLHNSYEEKNILITQLKEGHIINDISDYTHEGYRSIVLYLVLK